MHPIWRSSVISLGMPRLSAWLRLALTAPIVGLLLNLFIGIALGANVIIANAIGQKDEATIHKAVHTSIIMSILGGALIALIGEIFIGR